MVALFMIDYRWYPADGDQCSDDHTLLGSATCVLLAEFSIDEGDRFQGGSEFAAFEDEQSRYHRYGQQRQFRHQGNETDDRRIGSGRTQLLLNQLAQFADDHCDVTEMDDEHAEEKPGFRTPNREKFHGLGNYSSGCYPEGQHPRRKAQPADTDHELGVHLLP